MSGNQDRANRAAAWAVGLFESLAPLIDDCVTVMKAAPLKAGDLAGVERRARSVGVIARSARAVAALAAGLRQSGAVDREEDEMDHRDDSPETLERLRAELKSRLDRLNAVLETKGLDVRPGCWPTARSGEEPVRTT